MSQAVPPPDPSLSDVRREATAIVVRAREQAIEAKQAAVDELRDRQLAVEATEALLAERELVLRTLNQKRAEHQHSLQERRAEVEAQLDALNAERAGALEMIAEKAAMDHEQAVARVLLRVDGELANEHPDRVERRLELLVSEPLDTAQNHIAGAIQRQSASHTDGGQRPGPISLEELPDDRREHLVNVLGVIAEATGTELGVDVERQLATLRGLDPIGREIAREASLEVVDRHLQVADIHPLIINLRRSLSSRITEIGERAMWEMNLDGRPELAELVGTLQYRFSYGQNALLHCKEAGYLCGVLAAELGMDFAEARRAGMLHDIGKAVDHDVEGSHAIIGGELLDVFGTPEALTHAVKAHHFDVEPSTDLALLTICADAISASRPGARRDSMATYLARLEQLQEIATRHRGVERAFPLQAGREVRISVKPRSVGDDQVPVLCAEIAREIEAEMQFPGMIKVTVIRTTTATASSGRPEAEPLTKARSKRRRGGRGGGSADHAATDDPVDGAVAVAELPAHEDDVAGEFGDGGDDVDDDESEGDDDTMPGDSTEDAEPVA
jgi:ribonuclease Y